MTTAYSFSMTHNNETTAIVQRHDETNNAQKPGNGRREVHAGRTI